MIYGGCGSGKSTWWQRDMLKLPQFNNVREDQVMVVTSRAMTLDQTVAENKTVERINVGRVIDALAAGDDVDVEALRGSHIQMMTYDKLIRLKNEDNVEWKRTLSDVKIFVLDEVHSLLVDHFIPGMKELAVWVRDRLFSSDQYFIGITATPEVFLHINALLYRMPIQPVVDDVLLPYKVQNIICTDYVGAVDMIRSGELTGRSLFFCTSKTECSIAHQAIHDSAIVIGTNNRVGKLKEGDELPLNQFNAERTFEILYQDYMDEIRNVIAHKRVFPETIIEKNHLFQRYETRVVNTLITTSSLREGFNLDESSGVENVIVMSTADWEIKQIVGRCRYDVKNLVIVKPLYHRDDKSTLGYNDDCELLYDDFIDGVSYEWAYKLENITNLAPWKYDIRDEAKHRWESGSRYEALKHEILMDAFAERISQFVTTDEESPVYIYGKRMSNAICSVARKMSLFPGRKARDYTLNAVRKAWVSSGRGAETVRKRIGSTKQTCTILYDLKEDTV